MAGRKLPWSFKITLEGEKERNLYLIQEEKAAMIAESQVILQGIAEAKPISIGEDALLNLHIVRKKSVEGITTATAVIEAGENVMKN